MDTNKPPPSAGGPQRYQLNYPSLHGGRSFSFPCDAQGCVAMDDMSTRARENYLLAQSLVGREFQMPVVSLAVSG